MKGFQWDKNKQKINLEKHGIDFMDAIEIFNDDYRIEREVERNHEKRYETLGMINEVVCLVVFTYRGKVRRMISARKASKKERLRYEEEKNPREN